MDIADYFSVEAILADNQVRLRSFFNNTHLLQLLRKSNALLNMK